MLCRRRHVFNAVVRPKDCCPGVLPDGGATAAANSSRDGTPFHGGPPGRCDVHSPANDDVRPDPEPRRAVDLFDGDIADDLDASWRPWIDRRQVVDHDSRPRVLLHILVADRARDVEAAGDDVIANKGKPDRRNVRLAGRRRGGKSASSTALPDSRAQPPCKHPSALPSFDPLNHHWWRGRVGQPFTMPGQGCIDADHRASRLRTGPCLEQRDGSLQRARSMGTPQWRTQNGPPGRLSRRTRMTTLRPSMCPAASSKLPPMDTGRCSHQRQAPRSTPGQCRLAAMASSACIGTHGRKGTERCGGVVRKLTCELWTLC